MHSKYNHPERTSKDIQLSEEANKICDNIYDLVGQLMNTKLNFYEWKTVNRQLLLISKV